MPIYAYRCAQCGFEQDVLQKISDPKLTICPSCGAAAFEKQVTAAGFQLKGSGWYVTDFKNSGAAPAPTKSAKTDATESKGAGTAEGAAASPAGDTKGADSASTPSKGQESTAATAAPPAPAPSSTAAAPSKPSGASS